MEEKKTSDAMRKAISKYDSGFERVNCRFEQGTKSRIQKAGYSSINNFIKLAVAEKLEREEKILKQGTNFRIKACNIRHNMLY